MKSNPLISVIIPTYNRANFILRSVQSVTNQTYKNLEIIIIDDCSTDNTDLLLEKQFEDDRLNYHKLVENRGPSFARNYGISLAKGDYVAFQDSDDEWLPDKLEKQINILESNGYDFCFCGFEIIDSKTNQKTKTILEYKELVHNFKTGTYLQAPSNQTFLVKKSLLHRINGFDESLKAHEDTEITIRLLKHDAKYFYLQESLVKVYRNHDQLMGNAVNYIKANELLVNKHSDFLSKSILFSLSKQILNYYLIIQNKEKSKDFVRCTLELKKNDFKLRIQKILIDYFPQVIFLIYFLKYKNNLPNNSGIDND